MFKRNKRYLLIILDAIIACLAYIFAFTLRLGFELNPTIISSIIDTVPIIVIVQIALFSTCGLYKRVWRYTSLDDLFAILKAVSYGVIVSIPVLLITNQLTRIPRSIFIIDWLTLISLLGASRIAYRVWKEWKPRASIATVNTLIAGAGAAGTMLLKSILSSPKLEIKVIGFVDDDPLKKKMTLMGNPVLGTIKDLKSLIIKYKIKQILIAMPSAPSHSISEILEQCEQTESQVRTIPSLRELISNNHIAYDLLRPVRLDDLLCRSKVNIDEKTISEFVRGCRVLITGGGGSIGSELCRQIAPLNTAEIILIDHSEYLLYNIETELRDIFPSLKCSFYLANILDSSRIDAILGEKQPDIILHAAAYKHVPILENNLREGFLNNICGTLRMARAAIRHGVRKFVFISTDKAVNPRSVLGATKRVAELACQDLQRTTSRTDFIIVRFGNVLGSTGSVIPRFEEQINRGGPVTVTHPEVSRYFMLVSEASKLVLSAAASGAAGEIYVLDMGKPIRIVELAKALIRLKGYIPDRDIKIVFTGLRPGEKLHEELFNSNEEYRPTEHPQIFKVNSPSPPPDLRGRLSTILSLTDLDDTKCLMELHQLLPDFHDSVTYPHFTNGY